MGNRGALWLRSKMQNEAFLPLGRWTQRNAGKVLLIGAVFMAVLSIGMKNIKVENRVDQLWVEGRN